MANLYDRVQESTTTTGTGTYTLGGAVTGFRTFNSQAANGTVIRCVIEDDVGGYEVGDYTLGTNTLARTTIIESSNSNNAVNWGSGTKYIYSDATARDVLPDQTSNSGKFLITDGTNPAWSNTVSSLTLSSGTANGVLYLNGSKQATSGSALTFDGSNLGLGVTPSGWDNNFKAMQLGYPNFIAGHNGDLRLDIGVNAYFNGSYLYAVTGSAASRYQQAIGTHAWYTAPSGTAGSAISFTQAMTLNASGNLGIGQTSPVRKLDISAETSGPALRLSNTNGSCGTELLPATTKYSWFIGAQYNIDNGFEITASTAVGGTTFSTPVAVFLSGGTVGIGTSTPNTTSSILDVQSTTKGVRFPNMTTTQKNAIASPAAGLVVFDTTLAKLCLYTGAAWQTITSV